MKGFKFDGLAPSEQEYMVICVNNTELYGQHWAGGKQKSALQVSQLPGSQCVRSCHHFESVVISFCHIVISYLVFGHCWLDFLSVRCGNLLVLLNLQLKWT